MISTRKLNQLNLCSRFGHLLDISFEFITEIVRVRAGTIFLLANEGNDVFFSFKLFPLVHCVNTSIIQEKYRTQVEFKNYILFHSIIYHIPSFHLSSNILKVVGGGSNSRRQFMSQLLVELYLSLRIGCNSTST